MTTPADMAAATFDQFETPEQRQARWEAAALATGREIDRNALRAYMAVADAELQLLADDWAKSAAASDTEKRQLREQNESYRLQLNEMSSENEQLRARVAELEGPAVEARAALAALCYDLQDPGSNALGALYLLSRATVGVEAPKDDAAQALDRHAREVLHKAADMADPEPPEGSFFGGLVGPSVAAWLRMLADRPEPINAAGS